VDEVFPRLAERRRNLGNQLSGGEQQMLAVARALILNPRIMLLDEPLEGLAPIIVDELLAVFARLIREEGLSMIIVEQKARKILKMTDDALILDRGAIIHQSTSAAVLADEAAMAAHLSVTERRPARAGA
jgi:branched-chain amino acid transport system ATP-binding protein